MVLLGKKKKRMDPDRIFRPGAYVEVIDESHFLFGMKGKVVPVSHEVLKSFGVILNNDIPIDFGRYLQDATRHTHDMFGCLRGKTGYFLRPYQISKA